MKTVTTVKEWDVKGNLLRETINITEVPDPTPAESHGWRQWQWGVPGYQYAFTSKSE